MIHTCCQWFDNLMQDPGDKGFSILPFRDGDVRRFYLQARPFDRDFISKRDEIAALKLVPIAIAMDLPIRYCPRCGANLAAVIEQQREAFDKLADSMSYLMPKK